jgi:hypothetical protein
MELFLKPHKSLRALVCPVAYTHAGMDCYWAVTFPNQDHVGRILGWMAVFHFWATRQRTKRPIS